MKKIFLLQLFLLISSIAIAQSEKVTLKGLNKTRLQHTRKGMTILGSWALGNMLISPIMAGRSTGFDKHFYQMNTYWYIVNLGIAAFGYANTLKQDVSTLSLAASITEQQAIEKVLLFNTGLDVAYMLGGFYMIERSRRLGNQSERLNGFGRSIVLQGGFLFVFDLIFYLKMNQHGSGVMNMLSNVSLTPNSIGVNFVF
ncbi:MAG: hypothetical protein AAGJ93_08045 [Bacteroidota bacterium]